MSTTYDYTKRTEYLDDVSSLKAAHTLLKELPFTPSLPNRAVQRSIPLSSTSQPSRSRRSRSRSR